MNAEERLYRVKLSKDMIKLIQMGKAPVYTGEKG